VFASFTDGLSAYGAVEEFCFPREWNTMQRNKKEAEKKL